MSRIALAAALMIILIVPAAAQDAIGVITFDSWTEIAIYLVGTLITALVGWVLLILRKKFNLQIEGQFRDSLQTTLKNAAAGIIQKVGDRAKVSVNSPSLAEAIQYVVDSAPDALAKFGLSKEQIGEKILTWLPQVQPISPSETAALAPVALAPAGGPEAARTILPLGLLAEATATAPTAQAEGGGLGGTAMATTAVARGLPAGAIVSDNLARYAEVAVEVVDPVSLLYRARLGDGDRISAVRNGGVDLVQQRAYAIERPFRNASVEPGSYVVFPRGGLIRIGEYGAGDLHVFVAKAG